MAIDKATFTTMMCDSKQLIDVDNPVLKIKKNLHKLKFHNKLKDGNSHVKAELIFYELADKDGVPINEFCVGYTGTTLELPENGIFECNPKFADNFEYTITAQNHEKHDPVIIIEPQYSANLTNNPVFPDVGIFGPLGGGVFTILAAVAGACLFGAGMYTRGKMQK